MNEHDVDSGIKALFASEPPAPDPAFSDRVIRIAAYEQIERRARSRAVRRLISETLALVAILVAFGLLARVGSVAAEPGDTLSPGSPPMLALAMLMLWVTVGFRPATAES